MKLQDSLFKAVDEGNFVNEVKSYKLRHFFIPGGYARELTVPKGSIVIGKIHKYDCINIVTRGHLLVHTEEGTVEVKAPYTFVSKAGIKRVVVTAEESVWTTFHVTNETDLDKIEDALTVNTYEELEDRKLLK